jgi:hypothetical protein
MWEPFSKVKELTPARKIILLCNVAVNLKEKKLAQFNCVSCDVAFEDLSKSSFIFKIPEIEFLFENNYITTAMIYTWGTRGEKLLTRMKCEDL